MQRDIQQMILGAKRLSASKEFLLFCFVSFVKTITSAKRLSASKEFLLQTFVDKWRKCDRVLNAFRHRRNFYFESTLIFALRKECAKRLSASKEFLLGGRGRT